MRTSHQDATVSRAEGQPHLTPVVYLVDDAPSFLRALSRRLQAAGYQVEAFGSAEQFLRCRRSEARGCAVLDLRMPGPDGLGLQEALVKAEEPLPVMFLTAHGDVLSSVKAMKGGVRKIFSPSRCSGMSWLKRWSGHWPVTPQRGRRGAP